MRVSRLYPGYAWQMGDVSAETWLLRATRHMQRCEYLEAAMIYERVGDAPYGYLMGYAYAGQAYLQLAALAFDCEPALYSFVRAIECLLLAQTARPGDQVIRTQLRSARMWRDHLLHAMNRARLPDPGGAEGGPAFVMPDTRTQIPFNMITGHFMRGNIAGIKREDVNRKLREGRQEDVRRWGNDDPDAQEIVYPGAIGAPEPEAGGLFQPVGAEGTGAASSAAGAARPMAGGLFQPAAATGPATPATQATAEVGGRSAPRQLLPHRRWHRQAGCSSPRNRCKWRPGDNARGGHEGLVQV